MAKVIIDKDKCTGCGACANICPMDVFEIKDGKSTAVNENDCISCRACEVQCPADAITIKN